MDLDMMFYPSRIWEGHAKHDAFCDERRHEKLSFDRLYVHQMTFVKSLLVQGGLRHRGGFVDFHLFYYIIDSHQQHKKG